MAVYLRPLVAHAAGGRRDELQQRLPGRRLSATRLPYQRQSTPLAQLERHAIDRFHVADGALEDSLADREVDLQVLHFQKLLPCGPFNSRLGDEVAGNARLRGPFLSEKATRQMPP